MEPDEPLRIYLRDVLGDPEAVEAERMLDALIAAVRAENAAAQACEDILKLSAGWDANGCIGPTPPLSWESVGRMALDHARYALRPS